METNREIWRSIDGYTNYEVSTHGRVRNATTGRILRPSNHSQGYLKVGLRKDNLTKQYSIHRLVANEFIPNPNNLEYIDHIDGEKTNNNINNLRWASGTQNQGNRKKQNGTSSIYKGVHFCNRRNKWVAKIKSEHGAKHLGYFLDEKEAAKCYNEAAKDYFKEFAKLNVVID